MDKELHDLKLINNHSIIKTENLFMTLFSGHACRYGSVLLFPLAMIIYDFFSLPDNGPYSAGRH